MKRDMDLVYRILDYIERHHKGEAAIPFDPLIEDQSVSVMRYHVTLCVDAGYITGGVARHNPNSDQLSIHGHLTWKGHDALDEMRQKRGGESTPSQKVA